METHTDAIAELEALIERAGPTPDRLGLLGGQYERLFRAAATDGESLACLNRAIQSYERGMRLDLN